MNEFRFAEVGWLNAVWGVLLLGALLFALELRGRSLLDRMLSSRMQARLVRKTSLFRRLAGALMLAMSLLCLVLALMRPQWGMTVQTLTRVESQIMICLDVSKSMLAEDVVPNRLERAKTEIDSLLGLMDAGQQVGLTAFAGKATVLCPMTTDFGFLRLILAETGPASAGLGGTRIGEAIQKAVSGFRDTGDVNRLILLITDGEDHESFPLDAAKLAQEKGVRIVSVGFGDEAGSKIEITDPRTGGRSFVTDRNGVPVVSRLDGDTLRDIALQTEGAYIPAGTGALDLQSIYDTHIQTLLRGSDTEEERVIRNEAYQWCVLAALILLVASAMTTRFLPRSPATPLENPVGGLSRVAGGVLLVGLLAGHGDTALAQKSPDAPAEGETVRGEDGAERKQEGQPDSAVDSREAPSGDAMEDAEAKLPPRELYNQAARLVMHDPDRAERLLNQARQGAGVDGELRFRTLYNLGWVEVTRADHRMESEPEQALTHLEMAAGRFREAIRVRPESDAARHNLEVVARRILQLRDSLAKKNPRDLAARLDELIAAQREHLVQLQGLTDRSAADGVSPEPFRADFRKLGVSERQILSDIEKLARDARQQLTAQEDDAPDPREGDVAIQNAQRKAMLGYLDRSIQRMAKARSFTRRLQGSRAVLRWSAALTDAKRGRDQLRNPIEVLGVLISDASEVAEWTRVLDQSKTPSLVQQPGTEFAMAAPHWLSLEYLQESQVAMTQRTAELRAVLAAGARPPAAAGGSRPDDKEGEVMLESVRQALPLLQKAEEAFEQAVTQLASSETISALEAQLEGIAALMDAAEFFYGLRRLIEVMYRDEQRVLALGGELVERPNAPLASAAEQLQSKNLQRSESLARLLEVERQKLSQGGTMPPQSNSPGGVGNAPATASGQLSSDQVQAQQQRLELATQLLTEADQQMTVAEERLAALSATLPQEFRPVETVGERLVERPPSPKTTRVAGAESPHAEARDKVDVPVDSLQSAVENLEELRRLFFSIVEHLRETTQRQMELNDNTRELAGQPNAQDAAAAGPLQARQSQLQSTTEAIGEALQKQSEPTQQAADPTTTAPGGSSASGGLPGPASGEEARVLADAAALVAEGSQAMQTAADRLASPASILDSSERTNESATPSKDAASVSYKEVFSSQQTALEKLLEALALLDDQQSGQDPNNNQQNESSQEGSSEDQQQSPQTQQQNMNASQLLQLIRDREAQRRREKQEAQAVMNGGVEKDW